MDSTVKKYTVEKIDSSWYMKRIWKLQYDFADARINWLRDSTTLCHLHVFALLDFIL